LGSTFTNFGKCNEEVLNRTEQARRATRALNSLLWSKYILVNTKKNKYFIEIDSIFCQSENLHTGLQSKENVMKYINRLLEKSCKDLQTNKSKKGSHQRKNVGNTNYFGKSGKQYTEMVRTSRTADGLSK
jgi:hypothetical protein